MTSTFNILQVSVHHLVEMEEHVFVQILASVLVGGRAPTVKQVSGYFLISTHACATIHGPQKFIMQLINTSKLQLYAMSSL